ncbi:23S rRNA (pseudouridine(1915)-N(3))-methyltransferase RlmH [Nanoarchaeota archaeon]
MIRIIFVGKVKEDWIKEALAEYSGRLKRFVSFEMIEVKDEKIIGTDASRIIEKEGDKILALLKDDYVVALDVAGKEFASEEFAEKLNGVVMDNKKVTFVVGGALGLDKRVLDKARIKVSLSKMTMTNQMVRVLLLEQIYRAFTIMKGIEYHK